jgi:hypothetical protein
MYVCIYKIVLNYLDFNINFKINVEVNDGSSTDVKIHPGRLVRNTYCIKNETDEKFDRTLRKER